jgi:uncharacterized protein (TIGR02569 family)
MSGDWVVGGWSSSEWVSGVEDPSRWEEVLAAGSAFHDWLRTIPRPEWLESADDRWRMADRIAWGEAEWVGSPPFDPVIQGLMQLRDPIVADDQLIHGDLTGNVLFPADGGEPWVIDLSLYWRPAAYASAIVAVDCFEWEGTGEAILERVAAEENGLQMLVRAALFRSVRASMERWGDLEKRVAIHTRTLHALRVRVQDPRRRLW